MMELMEEEDNKVVAKWGDFFSSLLAGKIFALSLLGPKPKARSPRRGGKFFSLFRTAN